MTPVKIRGVLYRSVAEAARQLGLNQKTIYAALDNGTLDKCGVSWKPRPCTFDGVEYPSLAAAARSFGVSLEAVRQRVNRIEARGMKCPTIKIRDVTSHMSLAK